MHIVMVVVFGLIALAIFYFGARLFQRSGQAGAAVFIWVWLAAALVNGAVGVLQAGIPLLNEIGAFIPIFGVPAAVAWYLSRRHRAQIET
jgi:MFS superfamily sulfate permease-like transporter